MIEAKKDTIVLHIDHSDDEYLNELGIDSFRVQYKTDDGTWETAAAQEYPVNGEYIPIQLSHVTTMSRTIIKNKIPRYDGHSKLNPETMKSLQP